MSKKIKKTNNGIFYVVISLFVMFSILFAGTSILYAYAVSQTQYIETYNYNEAISQTEPTEPDVNLGGFPGPDIYQPMQFHDTVVLSPSIRKQLSFKPTSSLNLFEGHSRDAMASYGNFSGKDLYCDRVSIDLTSAFGDLTSSFSVGTTTLVGLSWTNTTTATLMASTSVAKADYTESLIVGTLSKSITPGSNGGANIPFLIKHGEYVVANATFYNATRSEDFLSSYGMNAAGYLNANCWYRN